MPNPINPYRVLQEQALATQDLAKATLELTGALRRVMAAGFPDEAMKDICYFDGEEERYVDEFLLGSELEIACLDGTVGVLQNYIEERLVFLSAGFEEE